MTVDILSALERARIPKRSGLVLTRTLAAGSCFTDRLTAPHFRRLQDRACPALVLATKERYTQNLRLISPFSRTEPYVHLVRKTFRAVSVRESRASARWNLGLDGKPKGKEPGKLYGHSDARRGQRSANTARHRPPRRPRLLRPPLYG